MVTVTLLIWFIEVSKTLIAGNRFHIGHYHLLKSLWKAQIHYRYYGVAIFLLSFTNTENVLNTESYYPGKNQELSNVQGRYVI